MAYDVKGVCHQDRLRNMIHHRLQRLRFYRLPYIYILGQAIYRVIYRPTLPVRSSSSASEIKLRSFYEVFALRHRGAKSSALGARLGSRTAAINGKRRRTTEWRKDNQIKNNERLTLDRRTSTWRVPESTDTESILLAVPTTKAPVAVLRE